MLHFKAEQDTSLWLPVVQIASHCLSRIPIKTFRQTQIQGPFTSLVASSDLLPNCIFPNRQDGGLLCSHPTLTLCSPWRTLHSPSCDKGLCALKHAVCLEPPHSYLSLCVPSRSQQHGQRLMLILCFLWHSVNEKAELSLLKLHV